MAKRNPHFRFGFTLLEILLAMGVALVVAAVAVPAIAKTWNGSTEGVQAKLDGMVREARERSVTERRPYVITLRDHGLCMEPEYSGEKADARRLELNKSAVLKMTFPSALGPVEPDAACWTFWADGTSEPVRVSYRDQHEEWSAVFDPLSGRREVSHD